VPRDGAIENELRTQTLTQGIILDGMPHVLAVLEHLGHIDSVRVTRVRCGQYTGVDGYPGKRTEIQGETFAEVKFDFLSYAQKEQLIKATAYLGKGIKGAQRTAIKLNKTHGAKVLDVEGEKGTVRFDFGTSKAINRETDMVLFDLNAQPHVAFLQDLLTDSANTGRRHALHVERGKRILEVMEDMRYPIRRMQEAGTALEVYPSGMSGRCQGKGKRSSPWLDDLLDGANNLSIIYGQ
jgi:hypothetical protein